jgi:hypothetical protein
MMEGGRGNDSQARWRLGAAPAVRLAAAAPLRDQNDKSLLASRSSPLPSPTSHFFVLSNKVRSPCSLVDAPKDAKLKAERRERNPPLHQNFVFALLRPTKEQIPASSDDSSGAWRARGKIACTQLDPSSAVVRGGARKREKRESRESSRPRTHHPQPQTTGR